MVVLSQSPDMTICSQCCLVMASVVPEAEREHSLWLAQAPGASAPAAGGGNQAADSLDEADEDLLAEVSFDGGFRVPGRIYNRLFDYQKTGKKRHLDLGRLHDRPCHTHVWHDAVAFMTLWPSKPAKCPHGQPCPQH